MIKQKDLEAYLNNVENLDSEIDVHNKFINIQDHDLIDIGMDPLFQKHRLIFGQIPSQRQIAKRMVDKIYKRTRDHSDFKKKGMLPLKIFTSKEKFVPKSLQDRRKLKILTKFLDSKWFDSNKR